MVKFLHDLPLHVLLNLISRHPVIFSVRCKQSPVPNVQIVFTDGSTNGKASIVTKNHQKVLETQETSAQSAEITTVIKAFAMFADEKFNLYSDSQYIVRLFPHIETVVLLKIKLPYFIC